ncbi:phage tail sheath C-terminal domain-containing protein [Xenorhabdus cabanillasii]|uniref:Predicted tail sheath protein n=1 Tax=Xenorhabdus cabanillasii JM26 TaxID=1427517 RepID=W1INW2_9GAMM|nr:phage tail sheath C-terminal domain-containing protein [Xenorhabdus cabanillasii]PHM76065.1 tail sheath protein [Xenorhabdus cabanillasii JM26]CDL80187.1 Predicted tail sheath protein [Xenorhabdus cabanillasii JM26]
MISFDTIPSSIRKPGKYLEFNTRMATRTLPGNPQRVLIIAPMGTDALAAELTPLDIYSDNEAARQFGAGSLAHLMARAAIQANSYLQLQVIGLKTAPAGRTATATLSLTGPATGSGTLYLWVGDQRLDIPVESGDSLDTLNGAVIAAVTAATAFPLTAHTRNHGSDESPRNVITLAARQAGEFGNAIRLHAECTAKGVGVTLSDMTGGENDPDIQPALDAVFAAGHHILICPFSTPRALLALRTHLDKTGNAMEQRGAIGVAGWTGTLATGTTLAGEINDGRLTLGWYPGSAKLPAELAAAYGAVIASEEDPARPLNTLPLAGLDITPVTHRASRNEQENALHNGLTPIEVGAGNRVQIVRAITTYTRNAEGVDDIALLDLTTIRTLDYTRKACRERISQRFPRDKLNERTRQKVRSELLDVLLKLEESEILENVEANKDKLLVERNDKDPNRLDAEIPADVVNGLHIFAGRIDLYL